MVSDLQAWGIPHAAWPDSLQVMSLNHDWSELVAQNVKIGIANAVKVGLHLPVEYQLNLPQPAKLCAR